MLPSNYYVGDNLELLRQLQDDSCDLVYFDPPYNTGRDFSDFKDRYPSMASYRDNFLKPRLVECKRIPKNTGNIVVHVDPTISHHVRILMDDIFGFKSL